MWVLLLKMLVSNLKRTDKSNRCAVNKSIGMLEVNEIAKIQRQILALNKYYNQLSKFVMNQTRM